MRRRDIKRRLARLVAPLSRYCHEATITRRMSWPGHELLELVEADVGSLSAKNRVSWKTFRRLDTRLPSLRLALRFDNLVNRAVARLKQTRQGRLQDAKPLIHWLVRMGHPKVEELAGANRAAALVIRKQIRLEQHARREKQKERARARKQRERLKKVRYRKLTLEEKVALNMPLSASELRKAAGYGRRAIKRINPPLAGGKIRLHDFWKHVEKLRSQAIARLAKQKKLRQKNVT